jgi:hypothetical protein
VVVRQPRVIEDLQGLLPGLAAGRQVASGNLTSPKPIRMSAGNLRAIGVIDRRRPEDGQSAAAFRLRSRFRFV